MPVADFETYCAILDPRTYLGFVEVAMAERVKQAMTDLRGAGKTMFAS